MNRKSIKREVLKDYLPVFNNDKQIKLLKVKENTTNGSRT
jgi:hypothetical protein